MKNILLRCGKAPSEQQTTADAPCGPAVVKKNEKHPAAALRGAIFGELALEEFLQVKDVKPHFVVV